MNAKKLFLKIAVILFVVIFSSQVFAVDKVVTDYSLVPQHVRGVERITNYDPRVQDTGWEDTLKLEPPTEKPILGRGYSDRRPAGTALVTSNRVFNQASPQGGVNIKVKGIEPTYTQSRKYEGWLVDEDTGYWLSLGVFSTDEMGNGRLNQATAIGGMPMNQKLYHSLDLYDAVAVTLEPYPDPDPRPSGNVALYGKITKPKTIKPQPTLQQKLWGMNKYYQTSYYNNPIANTPKKEVKK